MTQYFRGGVHWGSPHLFAPICALGRAASRCAHPGLMLRSIAVSAFTRVFDALWRCVSKHGLRVRSVSPISRDAPVLGLVRNEAESVRKSDRVDHLAPALDLALVVAVRFRDGLHHRVEPGSGELVERVGFL